MKKHEDVYIEYYNKGMEDDELAKIFKTSKRSIERFNNQLRKEGKIKYRKDMILDCVNEKAKILIFDIETTPIRAWVWGLFKQFVSLDQIDQDWQVLCYAGKWLDKDEIITDSLINYEDEFTPETLDDFGVISTIWQLFDEADFVIAHNGSRFDCTKINARFLYHGFPPPKPYKVIDTLKIAKAKFNLTSNKLDYISKYLGSEGKMKHEGFNLWLRCMNADKDAWKTMINYNIQDVVELETVYLKLRSWDSIHPSVAVFHSDEVKRCDKCDSTNIEEKGLTHTNVSSYILYQCKDCKGWLRSRYNERPKEVMKNTLRSR